MHLLKVAKVADVEVVLAIKIIRLPVHNSEPVLPMHEPLLFLPLIEDPLLAQKEPDWILPLIQREHSGSLFPVVQHVHYEVVVPEGGHHGAEEPICHDRVDGRWVHYQLGFQRFQREYEIVEKVLLEIVPGDQPPEQVDVAASEHPSGAGQPERHHPDFRPHILDDIVAKDTFRKACE
jgi:hypothetical protein